MKLILPARRLSAQVATVIAAATTESGGPQKGRHPFGNGETPKIRAWLTRIAEKITIAARKRQSKYSPALNEFRPARIAPKGTFEVRAAKPVHAAPSFRLRLASIENVPSTAVKNRVPNNTIEASSPFAAR